MPSENEKRIYTIIMMISAFIGGGIAIFIYSNYLITNAILGIAVILMIFFKKPIFGNNGGSIEEILSRPSRLLPLFDVSSSTFLYVLSLLSIYRTIMILFVYR